MHDQFDQFFEAKIIILKGYKFCLAFKDYFEKMIVLKASTEYTTIFRAKTKK